MQHIDDSVDGEVGDGITQTPMLTEYYLAMVGDLIGFWAPLIEAAGTSVYRHSDRPVFLRDGRIRERTPARN